MNPSSNKIADLNPIERFNNRVSHYTRYRPDYPEEIFTFLEQELQLNPAMTLADIGSGTGLFSKHLLAKKYKVFCVEPNNEMRSYAEKLLGAYPGFISKNGTGEQTTLENQSVDGIFVAQAFHWLNAEAAKKEFSRILKPGGRIVICWILASQASRFLKKYEELRQAFAVNYKPVTRNDEELLRRFFTPMKLSRKVFQFSNFLDFEALKGLLLSISFMPQPGETNYKEMINALKALFRRFSRNGFVEIKYNLPVYWNEN